MAGATIEFEDRKALAAIGAAVAVLRSPDRMFRDMGEALLIIHRKRFRAQTSPDGEKWQALSPAYQRRKKKNRDRVLVLDGYLRSTLRYQVEGGDLLFGSDRKYAAIHQFGGDIQQKGREHSLFFKQRKSGKVGKRFVKKEKSNFEQRVKIAAHTITMPARPFLGIGLADAEKLEAIAKRHLARALRSGRA